MKGTWKPEEADQIRAEIAGLRKNWKPFEAINLGRKDP